MKNKKRIKKIISYVSCIIIGYSLYPIISKQIEYYKARQSYIEYRKEKEDINKYPYWITIENTNIDYPIAYGKGNDYYLNHDIEGKENASGAIFFEEKEEPYDGINTIIYGHSMHDGSMFNNLHEFRLNDTSFKNSELTLRYNNEIKTYKPLGIYVTNKDFFFFDLDDMEIEDAVKLIQEKSKFKIDIEIKEDSHIITLMTCEYTENGNRLFVFYI